MKILLVDDEQPILDWLRLTITSLSTDYEIIGTATNGNDALALYRRMAPDIVFTDIKMPTMDGLAFLRELTNQQHYSYIVVLSNHDDFSYARESFMCNAEKYILKTEIDKESLEILLREAEEKVRSHATAGPSHSILNVELLIRRMAALTPVTEEQIEKAFSSGYNNLSPNGIFAVAVRLSAPLSIEQSANLPEQDHIKNVSLFYIDDLTILFLANIAHVHSALMRTSTIFAFASKIRTQFHCSIGISETYNGFAMLPQAIRQCMNALDMNFPHNVNANTMQIYSDTALQAMDYPFDTLMRGIEEQDLSTVCTEMNNLFSSIRSRTIVSRKQLIHLCKIMDYAMLVVRHKDDFMSITQDYDNFCSRINCVFTLDHMQELMMQLCHELVIPRPAAVYSYHIARSIRYLQDHFQKQITLQDLSRYTNLTPEYFCRLFKSEVGLTFNQYLTRLRMDHAMKLLHLPNSKINQIAPACGYSSVSYFSKVFKEYAGMNPQEYKRLPEHP